MRQVKLKVLLKAANEIIAKLHKDSLDAKIHEDSSKDKQQTVLLTKFKGHIEELTSGEKLSEKRLKELEDKINKVLDESSELTKNKDLKKQINDAFNKRSTSKGEKKRALKLHTIQRLDAIFATKGLEGSFDSSLNKLLTLLGVPESSVQIDAVAQATLSLDVQAKDLAQREKQQSGEALTDHFKSSNSKARIKQKRKEKKEVRKEKKRKKEEKQ
jgi:hypothetical protein